MTDSLQIYTDREENYILNNRETIIPARNAKNRRAAARLRQQLCSPELQELYLREYNGQTIIKEKLTEKNLKQLLRKIQKRKTLEAYLFLNSNLEGDFFNIETNSDWIAFQYVVNDGMKDGCFYSSFNLDYLDSDEESDTDTLYGCFMRLRYTMQDPKLAAKCTQYFARTGKLYPGMAWLKTLTG